MKCGPSWSYIFMVRTSNKFESGDAHLEGTRDQGNTILDSADFAAYDIERGRVADVSDFGTAIVAQAGTDTGGGVEVEAVGIRRREVGQCVGGRTSGRVGMVTVAIVVAVAVVVVVVGLVVRVVAVAVARWAAGEGREARKEEWRGKEGGGRPRVEAWQVRNQGGGVAAEGRMGEGGRVVY